ncbi:hypothetical protein BJF78_26000 [Pseudonocardia sp. CNS-139]|nr:hypothetical protein BJF78_26000 [Pseudonocardia sp. CNS-139]
MDALARLPCPDVPIKDATRWRPYADDGDTTPFEGDALLHTDWKPDNVLIEPAAVRVVDWSWPTRAAAWIDPACFLVQLIANGHTPAEADRWAMGTRAWRAAPPAAVDAFARATVRLWDEIADATPRRGTGARPMRRTHGPRRDADRAQPGSLGATAAASVVA